ncbi:MAG TPA: trypsin-like peptidase domain-containing protein [Baekduia sp.]|nr:trypsin-like peptidase domain-containing protein [Baekduia sp.]
MRSHAVLTSTLSVLAVLGGPVAVSGCGGSDTVKTVTASASASAAGAADLQTAYERVVQRVSPSVVQIQSEDGLGSGIVYDTSGHIVTNDHVLGEAQTFTVTLADGAEHKATLVGAFSPDDLAVIRLTSGKPPAATFAADSAKLRVGQLALALGNPLGLRSSVTQGIVSSVGRTVSEGNGAVIAAAVQTSAAINPGNSGGALIDIDGNVIGIPTLAATVSELGGSQAAGIGFAIPASTVRRIADQLISSGKVTDSGRAFLGVSVASLVSGEGVVVSAVTAGSAADKAGIERGDVIVSVAGTDITSGDDLSVRLAELRPGQTVPVTIQHPDGTKKTVQVKLGETPAS